MLTLSVPGAPSALDPLLALDECVPFSKGFDFDKINITSVQGEVALYDGSACPDSLSLDPAAFAEKFNNKVVLWFGGFITSTSCFKDFFYPYDWYKTLIDAGAIAVITLVDEPGRTPGVWYPSFWRDRWAGSNLDGVPDSELIPFISCAMTSAHHTVNTASLSKPQRLVDFMAARLLDLDTRADLTKEAALNLGNSSFDALANSEALFARVDVAESQWKALFQSLTYGLIFHGFISLLFFIACGLGVWFTIERIKSKLREGRGMSWRKAISVSVVALQIEILASFVCGLFFAVDGMWANTESFMSPMRTLMLGQLTLVSLGSSVLVGLTFNDLRQSSKLLRPLKSGFVGRHRSALFVLAGLLIGVEAIGTVLRRSNWSVYVLANGAAYLVGLGIAIWFAVEAWSFSNALTDIATQATIVSTSHGKLRHVIKHTRFWGFAHSISLLVLILSAVFLNLHPYILWNVNTWPVCWAIIAFFRAAQAICKIMLCRLPPALDQRGNATAVTFQREDTNVVLGGITRADVGGTMDYDRLEKTESFTVESPSM